jgi:TIR domain
MGDTMNPSTIPQHVFISFSQADKDFVEKFTGKLREEGIPIWIDYGNLVVGTPDWEAAIRDAISASFAVLLIASPESTKSPYVKGELNVARARGCPIYPVWATGTEWANCVPLEMTMTQYIDCRGERYSKGVL